MIMRRETQKEFLANVGKVISGEMTVVDFRRKVITFTTEEFKVSFPCAATQYLFALGMYLADHPKHKEILMPEMLLDEVSN